jgi:acetylglutamate kinase
VTEHAPFVLKLGGEVVQSADLATVAGDVRALVDAGYPLAVVHGGGPQATALSKRLGLTPTIVGGRRVTDRETLDVMKMAVAGQVNVDLCAALVAAGARPVGLHGASDRLVHAVKRPPRVVSGAGPDPIDFGHVGDVVGVRGELLRVLLNLRYVPVIACLGAGDDGTVYNINADTVANHVAIALGARALVVVTDVPGVLRDVADPSSRIARLGEAEAKEAIAAGVVTKGMIPKLEESFAAIRAGVRAVHVVGKLGHGDLVRALTEPGSVGTVLTP